MKTPRRQIDLTPHVDIVIGRLGDILNMALEERQQLGSFMRGERVSSSPLGSKWLLNRGNELQQLVSDIEHWSREGETWKRAT